jgi:hypothetical protein
MRDIPADISHLDSMSESEPGYLVSSAHSLAHSDASSVGTAASCSHSRAAPACAVSPGSKKPAMAYQAQRDIVGQAPGVHIKAVISGKKRSEPDEDKDENSAAANASEPLTPSKRPNTEGGGGTEYALAASKVGNGHFSDARVELSTHSASES